METIDAKFADEDRCVCHPGTLLFFQMSIAKVCDEIGLRVQKRAMEIARAASPDTVNFSLEREHVTQALAELPNVVHELFPPEKGA